MQSTRSGFCAVRCITGYWRLMDSMKSGVKYLFKEAVIGKGNSEIAISRELMLACLGRLRV